MSGVPKEEEEEIPDSEVPKASAPKTGDKSGRWLLAAAASLVGMALLVITGKKKSEEE